METVIKKDLGGTVSVYYYVAETAATASELSSVTGQAWTPGGGELVSETAITPAADGKMSLSVSVAESGTAYDWCKARFKFTYDSQVRTKEEYFHIAQTDFDIPFHFDPDLISFQPDIGDYDFSNDANFAKLRDSAVWELYARLLNAQHKPWLVINRYALKVVFARLWLAHIYEALSNTPGDNWSVKAIAEREMYESAFLAADILERDDDSSHNAGLPARPIGETILRRG